jgi:hypothetical protein
MNLGGFKYLFVEPRLPRATFAMNDDVFWLLQGRIERLFQRWARNIHLCDSITARGEDLARLSELQHKKPPV